MMWEFPFPALVILAQAARLVVGVSVHDVPLPNESWIKDHLAAFKEDLTREMLGSLEQQNKHVMRRIDAVEGENAQLKTLLEVVMSEKAELEERVDYLEAITRKDVPRTCQDLKNLGVTKSGQYLIDPDGAGIGEAPINADCDMTTGATKIHHNVNGTVAIDHCPDPGCFAAQITYTAPLEQIQALVQLSAECTQAIRYDCFVSPLIENGEINLAWWVGIDGQPNYYWDGIQDNSDVHVCACDAAGSCSNPAFACNCDSSAPQWLSDEGVLTNEKVLPVQELRFGGLIYDGQQAAFELGSFQCSGKKAFRATESCETLRMAGATVSGYYIVDGDNGLHFDTVLCNMDLNVDESQFQVGTSLKWPEYPVAFDFRRIGDTYSRDDTIVPYEEEVLNAGGAMTMEGVFTAPFDGVYAFTFAFTDDYSSDSTWVKIRKNGSDSVIAGIHSRNSAEVDVRDSASDTGVTALNKGDTVDVYIEHGALYGDSNIDAHFTGYLLYPL